MSMELDQYMMRLALEEAAKATQSGEIPVGAIIADLASNNIIARAHNCPIAENDPSAHAEICALRRAGQAIGNYRLGGMGMWVTLEPCAMCAGAMIHARIELLVFAASDPKGGAVQHGARLLDPGRTKLQWRSGIMADEASAMLKGFFAARRL